MRKLMWFTIGFAGACAIGTQWQDPVILLAGLLLIFLSLTGFFFSSKGLKKAAIALFGMGFGLLWVFGFLAITLQPAKTYHEQEMSLEVEVTNFSWDTENAAVAEGKVFLQGRTYPVEVYLYRQESLAPGDTLRGTFFLKLAQDPYSLGQGIILKLYGGEDVFVHKVDRISPVYLAPLLRDKLLNLLYDIFPEDTLGFAQAILLGKRDGLSDSDMLSLQSSGIAHVVSVSGMHVSILFGLVYELCRKRKWLTAAIAIPVLLLFAAMNGFSPSATRACIMQIILILSLLADREYDPMSSLSFAVLLILGSNPLSILHPGFQLSAGSMLGIFLVSGRVYRYAMDKSRLGRFPPKSMRGRICSMLMKSLSVTAGAMVFTIPFCAYHFSVISIVAPVANLLLLGIITVIFYGVMLCAVIGCFWTAAGSILAFVLSFLIRLVVTVAGFLGSMPLATVNAQNIYVILWLVFAYVLLLLFLLLRNRRPFLLGSCIVAGFLAAMLCSHLEKQYEGFQLTVLDVGQGQCIILQNEDFCYVVDCGGSSGSHAAMLAYTTLRDQGVDRIDGLILTHYDKDHIGGVRQLMSYMEADTLYLPLLEEIPEEGQRILEMDPSSVQYVTGQLILPADNGTVTLFPAEKDSVSAETGLCVLFQMENCDILITGDRNIRQEQLLLEQASLPDLEILIAGHHGSASSTGIPLLMATTPEVIIVSSGTNAGYNHPSPEFLRRVEDFGCTVLRTDELGTIMIRR